MLVLATIALALLLVAFVVYVLVRPRFIDARFACRLVGVRSGHIEMRDGDRVAHFSCELRDDATCAIFLFDSGWILPSPAPLSAAERSRMLVRLRGWGAARGIVVVTG